MRWTGHLTFVYFQGARKFVIVFLSRETSLCSNSFDVGDCIFLLNAVKYYLYNLLRDILLREILTQSLAE